MSVSQLKNPVDSVNEVFEDIVNGESSTALAHGDVVIYDLANMVIDTAANLAAGLAKNPAKVILTTSASDRLVAGVVYDPAGLGIAAGARGCIMKRGFHPAVKKSTNTITNSQPIQTGTAAGTMISTALTSATTYDANAGYALITANTAATTFSAFISVEK